MSATSAGPSNRGAAPPAPVLAAFGADGPPVPLPGGQGSSWRAGGLVLKPVGAAEESSQRWLYEVARPAVTDAGTRPEPRARPPWVG